MGEEWVLRHCLRGNEFRLRTILEAAQPFDPEMQSYPAKQIAEIETGKLVYFASSVFEQRYPRFQATEYKPTTPEEAEAYNQYQSLKAVEYQAATAEIMRRSLPQQERFNQEADRILTSMGLSPASHDLKELIGPKTYSNETERKRRTSPAIREPEIPRLWADLLKRGSISQADAASYLKCCTKTIRRIVARHELTKSRAGRIACDERLRNQIRKVHGQHVLR